uniref:WD_REPEATS_REGION domain-containing protein n=1 Tax=Macrostomum lignano TaxID=282301 RepID=A0A1I8GU46_9PLAT
MAQPRLIDAITKELKQQITQHLAVHLDQLVDPAVTVDNMLVDDNGKKLYYACFTCCPENGALVFNVNPLAYLGQLDGEKLGSLSSASMLGRSNMFALVGGGKTPKFAENAVIIWDEAKKDFVMEYAFNSPVLGVLLRKSGLVVLLQSSVQIFDFPGQPERRVARLDCWPAAGSARGLASLSGKLLAFAARGQPGYAQLVRLDRLNSAPVLIHAHQAPLAALQLSPDGELLATAGSRGTLVRLFGTANRRLLRQLRRGADPALLYSLAWSPASDWVCAASDKGTVHVWSVGSGASTSSFDQDADQHVASSSLSSASSTSSPQSSAAASPVNHHSSSVAASLPSSGSGGKFLSDLVDGARA